MSATFIFDSHSEADTQAFGRRLAESLPPQAVVALHGTLGAGKTRLVQAVAIALGVPHGTVVSPTFVLVQEYEGVRPIYHFDAYRLTGEHEFWDLGPDEYFSSQAITFVEWADRVSGCLPAEYLQIRITALGATDRRFEVEAVGDTYQNVVARLAG